MDYDYIKSHYRLIAVDLSRQKELDADPKAIQQIEFIEQLKNHTHVKKVGHTSEFLFGIYWWTWKTNNY